jgi:hypothetical protein
MVEREECSLEQDGRQDSRNHDEELTQTDRGADYLVGNVYVEP